MPVSNPRNQITDRPQIKAGQTPIPRQVIPPKVSPAELQQMRQKSQQAMKLAEQSRLNAQQMRQKADQMRQAMPVMPATTLPSQVTTQPAPRITTDPIQQNQQSFMDPSMISGFAGVGALPSPQYDIVGNVNMPFMGVPPQRLPSDAPSITHQNYGNQQANYQQQQGGFGGGMGAPMPQFSFPQGGFGGQQGGLAGAMGDMGAMEWGVPNSITYGTTGGYNPQNTSYGSGFQPMGGFQNIGSLLG